MAQRVGNQRRGTGAAIMIDVPTNRITEILNRRRAITGDTALRLAHFFLAPVRNSG